MVTSSLSSSNARASRKHLFGLRLVLWLCFLILLLVLLVWMEDPEPLQAFELAAKVTNKADFWGTSEENTLKKKQTSSASILTDDDQTMANRIQNAEGDDDDNLFSENEGPYHRRKKGKNVYIYKDMQQKKRGNSYEWTKKNKYKENKLLRRHQTTNEKFQAFPIVQNTDDNIPSAAGGSIVHAADVLLCRDSVMDYVINATDLKDECDGLKKAYTQTCASDEQLEPESQLDTSAASTRQRRLQTTTKGKTNGVAYWRLELLHWSHKLRSLWSKSRIFLTKEKIPEVWDETALEIELKTQLLSNGSRGSRRRALGKGVDDYEDGRISDASYDEIEIIMKDDDDGYEPSKSEMIRTSQRRIKDQVRNNQDGDNSEDREWEESLEGKKNPTSRVPGDGFKTSYDPPANGVLEVQLQAPLQEGRNTTIKAKESGTKKPLANLALPVTAKHVSGKMLSETLMLQQDNKLMKAVANQTNTEAKNDAAASSKAVADAASMISNVLNDPTSVEARTCCTSILNAFHEICSVGEDEELSDRWLLVGVAVIACCGLVKSLIRYFQIRWLPEAAGCIMVGVSAGYISTFFPHHDISFDGKWFLRIMVPPIVFEAALSIDKRSFRRHIVPILIYAVIGTLIATCVTAIIVSEGSKLLNCETIHYPEALAFGSLISSIDPIAVLSVLSNMGMTDQDTIYVVIFGESLLNDGVAIVLFETLVHFLDDDMVVDVHAVSAATIHFLVVFIGSLLVGIGYGLCCTLYYWIMFGCQTPLVEVLMFCCWALLPYYVCDGIEWSGIVAVVAAGFIMDMYVVGTEKLKDTVNDETDSNDLSDSDKGKERRRQARVRRPIFSKEGLLSNKAKTHITFVTEIIATMMETAIFAYLGLFLFSSRYHWNFNHVFISILGCSLSRAIMIPSLSFTANWITKLQQSGEVCLVKEIPQQSHQIDTPSNRPNQAAGVIIDSKMQLVLWFAGLRGAMSFALVEHIPQYDAVSGEGTRLKSELKAMTSACIIFTVFVLGGGTYYMMEALGLSPKSSTEGALELETEMVGLLSSTSTIESNDVRDNANGKDWMQQNNENDMEIIKRKPSTNALRRPGKPVRRQRNSLN